MIIDLEINYKEALYVLQAILLNETIENQIKNFWYFFISLDEVAQNKKLNYILLNDCDMYLKKNLIILLEKT